MTKRTMTKATKAKAKMGRPRLYAQPTEKGTLHLPPAFWDVVHRRRREMSRSRAFVAALLDDAELQALRDSVAKSPPSG